VPREFVEEQRTVLDELQEALRRWEEMQAAATLGRIEMQVSELRDLLVGGLSGATADESPNDAPEAAPEGAAPQPWEAMKAEILSDGSPPESDGLPPDSADTDPEAAAWIDPPPAIDLAAATTDDLRNAVEARDEYIAWLIRRLRAAESPRRMLSSTDDNAPAELRQRLEELEHAFDERLRLAEIEMSLERARLAREGARIRLQDEQVQKQLRQPGAETARKPAEENGPDAAKNRRWRRILGISGDGQ
jgi:hypothetical protein